MIELRSGLGPVLDELLKRASRRLKLVNDTRPNEIYLETEPQYIAEISLYLCRIEGVRLALVFAVDRREQENTFYIQYVFAFGQAGSFLFIRTPVPADHPEFPSLTPAIPAVNW
jgi:Ni,Fe-hydrogenase III component G